MAKALFKYTYARQVVTVASSIKKIYKTVKTKNTSSTVPWAKPSAANFPANPLS